MGWLGNLSIKTKMMVLYMTSILLSTSICLSLTYYNSQKELERRIGEMSAQTLYALDNSMALMTDHVKQDANVLFWNEIVQDILGDIGTDAQNLEIRAQVKDCLINMMLAGDYISSILLFDNFGNSYNCVREGVMMKNDIPVEEAPWYRRAVESNGDWIFETDGGGMVTYKGANRNILSMVKVIKSKKDYSDLGILMVNIDEKTVRRYFQTVGNNTRSNFYIISQGELLFGPDDGSKYERCRGIIASLEAEEPLFVRHEGGKAVYQKIDSSIEGWAIVGETPVESFQGQFGSMQTAVILAVNILLMLLCWFAVTFMLSKPIRQMEEQINAAQGQLQDIPVESGKEDEIVRLKQAYNRMMQSIRELIAKTKEEEKIIRRNELDLILEQISPHFLYNTLDTISALTLIGENGKVFKATQALGRFYRNSLNSGQQMVTVKEELEMIKSYLTILNIRYSNQIQPEYDVDEDILGEEILKLVLQPLVENAVHHGICLKQGAGRLIIRCSGFGEDKLELSVWDDGVGMDKDKIEMVLSGKGKKKPGFGIYSVKQRLELFYGIKEPLKLESEAGQWTKVTVYAMRGK